MENIQKRMNLEQIESERENDEEEKTHQDFFEQGSSKMNSLNRNQLSYIDIPDINQKSVQSNLDSHSIKRALGETKLRQNLSLQEINLHKMISTTGGNKGIDFNQESSGACPDNGGEEAQFLSAGSNNANPHEGQITQA